MVFIPEQTQPNNIAISITALRMPEAGLQGCELNCSYLKELSYPRFPPFDCISDGNIRILTS